MQGKLIAVAYDIRLVLTLPPKDSKLQYKNAYTSEITFLDKS